MKARFSVAVLSLGLALLGSSVASVQADDGAFVITGPPDLNGTREISPVSFDHLIPTIYPTINSVVPNVPASSDNLVHPTDQPVIPQGTP
jgi:hypothetical protein